MVAANFRESRRVCLTGVRGPVSALMLVLVALGCGGEAPETATTTTAEEDTAATAASDSTLPTVDEAATLVAGSAEFSEYQSKLAAYELPLQMSAMAPSVRGIAGRLTAAGWIAVEGDGRIVLTPKARYDPRFLVRANDVVEIVPLARKDLKKVESVYEGRDGNPVVEFRWEWTPNEIGELFALRYSNDNVAMATLDRKGNGWSVRRIVAKPQRRSSREADRWTVPGDGTPARSRRP